MRIGFDGHFIRPRGSGNGVSTRLLLEALADVDSENEYVVYLLNNGVNIHNRNFQLKQMHALHANSKARFLFTFPVELLRHRVDIFHAIFTVPFLPDTVRPRIVLTVPEIPWFTDPESFPASSFFSAQVRLTTRYSIGKANRIITLTDIMKKQITRCFRVPDNRVEVIPWGVDDGYFQRLTNARIENVTRRLSIAQPYILCVGDLHPRKNQIALVRAYTKLRQKHSIPHQLVLAGKPLYKSEEIYAAVETSSLGSSIRVLGYVEPDQLPALYQGASMFVFPSLHEGFGLPVHEAMASAVPVVSSDRDALPEVAGDAAILVDPEDVDSIACAILRLIDDTSLGQRLIEKGLTQARRFSWRESANRVISVYRQVYAERSQFAA